MLEESTIHPSLGRRTEQVRATLSQLSNLDLHAWQEHPHVNTLPPSSSSLQSPKFTHSRVSEIAESSGKERRHQETYSSITPSLQFPYLFCAGSNIPCLMHTLTILTLHEKQQRFCTEWLWLFLTSLFSTCC